MKESVVDVGDLSKHFGKTLALDNVNFVASQGNVYGLVGANGVGKTTLLKHMLGLYRSETGTVRVFGLDPVAKPVEVLQRIGYMSEDRALPEWMRIDDLMRYTQAYHPNWDSAYARELLDTFQLDATKRIKELSKGMRAQTCLIAAVAHRPDLLIMDEPSTGLDAVVRRSSFTLPSLRDWARAKARWERWIIYCSRWQQFQLLPSPWYGGRWTCYGTDNVWLRLISRVLPMGDAVNQLCYCAL